MTPTQTQALAKIRAAGTLYAYNGVSLATARALERQNLVTVTVYPARETHGRRTRYVADWSVTAKPPQ